MAEPQFPLTMVLLFCALGIAVAVAVWQISVRRARARTEALKRQAMITGFAFRPEEVRLGKDGMSSLEASFGEALGVFELFQRGRRRRVWNVLSRDDEGRRRDWVFDFQYETGGGKNSQRIRQTVFGSHHPEWNVPAFTLQKEGLFSRIFDGSDIDFEQDEAFSRQYLLKGKDETPIKRLFTPSLRSFLVEKQDWVVQGAGTWVFACRKGKLVKPEELTVAYSDFNRLVGLIDSEMDRQPR